MKIKRIDNPRLVPFGKKYSTICFMTAVISKVIIEYMIALLFFLTSVSYLRKVSISLSDFNQLYMKA